MSAAGRYAVLKDIQVELMHPPVNARGVTLRENILQILE